MISSVSLFLVLGRKRIERRCPCVYTVDPVGTRLPFHSIPSRPVSCHNFTLILRLAEDGSYFSSCRQGNLFSLFSFLFYFILLRSTSEYYKWFAKHRSTAVAAAGCFLRLGDGGLCYHHIVHVHIHVSSISSGSPPSPLAKQEPWAIVHCPHICNLSLFLFFWGVCVLDDIWRRRCLIQQYKQKPYTLFCGAQDPPIYHPPSLRQSVNACGPDHFFLSFLPSFILLVALFFHVAPYTKCDVVGATHSRVYVADGGLRNLSIWELSGFFLFFSLSSLDEWGRGCGRGRSHGASGRRDRTSRDDRATLNALLHPRLEFFFVRKKNNSILSHYF